MKRTAQLPAPAKVFLLLTSLMLCGAMVLQGQGNPPTHYYDTDLDEWLIDTDGDGTVDLSEEIGGYDPLDPLSFPGDDGEPETLPSSLEKNAGFPTTFCRAGFTNPPGAWRLCVDFHEQNATRYDTASAVCRRRYAHVCTYEDLFYLYNYSTLDASYNPRNNWIGNWHGDDNPFCGNRDITFNNDPDMWNFEDNCDKSNRRSYWCCHDKE